ncbi:hypothetical protein M271_09125 [Streptomyces rapamycinicus NRRL 5491]|nr:hypothetical protein M271_09125 [Streptomyces rapamycinicus NRRL 5491]
MAKVSARPLVAISTADRTSSGRARSSSWTMMPPREKPTTRHGPAPRCSMRPAMSAAMSSRVKPSAQGSLGGIPRLSTVTTLKPAALSAGTWWVRHIRPGAPVPVTMTTGSPVPCSS